MCYTLEEVRELVNSAVAEYNSSAAPGCEILRVTLFGSYADGTQDDESDVDLLVTFKDHVVSFFTLARALESMEKSLAIPVDLVQEPLPEDALLVMNRTVPLYEAA